MFICTRVFGPDSPIIWCVFWSGFRRKTREPHLNTARLILERLPLKACTSSGNSDSVRMSKSVKRIVSVDSSESFTSFIYRSLNVLKTK